MDLANRNPRNANDTLRSAAESIPNARTEYYGISPIHDAWSEMDNVEGVIGPFPSIGALESYLNNPKNECVGGSWTVVTKVKKITKLVVARSH